MWTFCRSYNLSYYYYTSSSHVTSSSHHLRFRVFEIDVEIEIRIRINKIGSFNQSNSWLRPRAPITSQKRKGSSPSLYPQTKASSSLTSNSSINSQNWTPRSTLHSTCRFYHSPSRIPVYHRYYLGGYHSGNPRAVPRFGRSILQTKSSRASSASR